MATKIATKTSLKSTGSVSDATTMEALLAAEGKQIHGFKRGDTVKGKVIEVTGRTVYVDINGKADAVVSEKEFSLARDYFRNLKAGDEVSGVVLVSENDAGQVILSLRRAASDAKWKLFEQAMNDEETVTVRGKDVTKGGLLVDADGVFGFVPASQLSREFEGNAAALVGKPIQVKVVEVDRTQNRLVFSEKAVTEAEEIGKRKAALEAVEIGKEYDGEVVGLVPFGVFVSVKIGRGAKAQDVEGLVHISEVSWEKVEDVTKFVKAGDKVKVQVIGLDEENGKLALSMKRLSTDPWVAVAASYPVDSKHKGTVTKIVPYGILVKIQKGIEGLIHASKMPSDMAFAEGQEVEVFVESVDLSKRRLSLGVVVKDTKGMIYK